MDILVNLLLIIPILAAVAMLLGAPGRLTGLVVSIFGLISSVILFLGYDADAGGMQFLTKIALIPSQGITYGVGIDGLTLTMILLTWIVAVAAFAVEQPQQDRPGLYNSCLLFIAAGANAAFLTTDLFWMYAFHELALIPTFLLIGIWGWGSDRQGAAWKVTLYLGLGSLILLAGLLALYLAMPEGQRTFDIPTMQAMASQGVIDAETQQWIYLLLLIGFGILVSLFPFHTWAPTAYAAAPTPAAMLHAGVLKKFGLYGLLRVANTMLPEGAAACSDLLLTLVLGNILFVGLAAISQRQFDLTLGYSSVMHMGYLFLAVAATNAMATQGAALLMLGHGLSVAALFAICGEIRSRTGTTLYSELGGLVKAMPILTFLTGFALFASIGLPGFANFAGELLVFFGAFSHQWQATGFGLIQYTVVAGLIGVVFSAVYMLRAYKSMCFGEPAGKALVASDINPGACYAVGTLIVALLLFGFLPSLLLQNFAPAEVAVTPATGSNSVVVAKVETP